MPRVVSGFRKHRRSQRSAFFVLATAWKWLRRLLSMPIATLPSLKRVAVLKRPQTYLKRDVHKKSYGNPYTKTPFWTRVWTDYLVAYRFGIASTTLVLVLVFWFSMVFLQPTFYINRITIHGNAEINAEEIRSLVQSHLQSKAFALFPRSHRLFLGLDSLRESITTQYHLESLVFAPDWTAHGLEIHLREKPSLFLYGIDDRYFALDREGQVIREMPKETDPNGYISPVLYEYDSRSVPAIGERLLTPQFIASIQRLSDGFVNFPEVAIHSFRIRISPQRQIVMTDTPPVTDQDKANQNETEENALTEAAESIAQAHTIDEKVRELKEALENLSIEKLEEGKLDQLLREQRVYAPKEGFNYKELEIYTAQGWSIKLGHDVFEDALAADTALAIFATLEQAINLKEVREYVDLRIPNRVYYR